VGTQLDTISDLQLIPFIEVSLFYHTSILFSILGFTFYPHTQTVDANKNDY